MKRSVSLTITAVLLCLIAIAAIWHINRNADAHREIKKDAFIPYNSSVVMKINAGDVVNWHSILGNLSSSFEKSPLFLMENEVLMRQEIDGSSKIFAIRENGNSGVSYLYALSLLKDWSIKDIKAFLKLSFPDSKSKERSYENFTINTLHLPAGYVYWTKVDLTLVISDSDFYIEDAIKQYMTQADASSPVTSKYHEVEKYFVPDAGMNVFLNKNFFSKILGKTGSPMFDNVQWAALDFSRDDRVFMLNGFMDNASYNPSFAHTLYGQKPMQSMAFPKVPSGTRSFYILNLSDKTLYFEALNRYRTAKKQNTYISGRKQALIDAYGINAEMEVRNMLSGEIVVIDTSMVVSMVKSESIATEVVARMMDAASRSAQTITVGERSVNYWNLTAGDLASVWWGDVFGGQKHKVIAIVDNMLVLAVSQDVLSSYVESLLTKTSINDDAWFADISGRFPKKFNYASFNDVSRCLSDKIAKSDGYCSKILNEWTSDGMGCTGMCQVFASEDDMLYVSFAMKTVGDQQKVSFDYDFERLGNSQDAPENVAKPIADTVVKAASTPKVDGSTLSADSSSQTRMPEWKQAWQIKLEAAPIIKPVVVVNHYTKAKEFFVQDDSNIIYLISADGKMLWRRKIEDRINSDVVQVDYYKNSKLQMMFSTKDKLYLVDRNGNPVKGFPKDLPSATEIGITIVDYDNDKNYRIIVPGVDKKIYVLDKNAEAIKGWNVFETDKKIITSVVYNRVMSKDYLVFADASHFYALDRRGQKRFVVSDLKLKSWWSRIRYNVIKRSWLISGDGCLYYINNLGKSSCVEGMPRKTYDFTFCPSPDDKTQNIVIVSGSDAYLVGIDGKTLSKVRLGKTDMRAPYAYDMTSSTSLIGTTDGRMLTFFNVSDKIGDIYTIDGCVPATMIPYRRSYSVIIGTEKGFIVRYDI